MEPDHFATPISLLWHPPHPYHGVVIAIISRPLPCLGKGLSVQVAEFVGLFFRQRLKLPLIKV